MFFDRKQASSILYSPVLGKQPLTTVNQQQQQQQQAAENSTELVIARDIIEHDQQPRREVSASLNDSHLFDTYEQVTHLQAWGGFSRGQAKAVMETIQNLLRIRYLSTYLFSSSAKEKATTTLYIPPRLLYPFFPSHPLLIRRLPENLCSYFFLFYIHLSLYIKKRKEIILTFCFFDFVI